MGDESKLSIKLEILGPDFYKTNISKMLFDIMVASGLPNEYFKSLLYNPDEPYPIIFEEDVEFKIGGFIHKLRKLSQTASLDYHADRLSSMKLKMKITDFNGVLEYRFVNNKVYCNDQIINFSHANLELMRKFFIMAYGYEGFGQFRFWKLSKNVIPYPIKEFNYPIFGISMKISTALIDNLNTTFLDYFKQKDYYVGSLDLTLFTEWEITMTKEQPQLFRFIINGEQGNFDVGYLPGSFSNCPVISEIELNNVSFLNIDDYNNLVADLLNLDREIQLRLSNVNIVEDGYNKLYLNQQNRNRIEKSKISIENKVHMTSERYYDKYLASLDVSEY